MNLSRPYYETRANVNAKLRNMKTRIIEMEKEVQRAKAAYNEALQNLEKISDEIHKMREDEKLNEYHEEVRKLFQYEFEVIDLISKIRFWKNLKFEVFQCYNIKEHWIHCF